MRIPVKWGIILAVAIALWTLVIHALGFYTDRVQYASTVDIVVIVLPLIVFTLAMLEARRKQEGVLAYWRGVYVGVITAAVSAPLTVGFMWFYHHVINPDWMTYLVNYEQQKLAAAGVSSVDIAARVAQMQQGAGDVPQIVAGLIGTVLMGFVLSLGISGALLLLKTKQQANF